ncbi:MAG: hypothetical protein GYA23_07220 [Methanomicrobiales archaeon]|nr:hypothetical protein [Methanomicrobiales archaeon]
MSAPLTMEPSSPVPLRDEISREYESVRQGRTSLLMPGEKRRWEILILLGCLIINGLYLLFRPDYVTLFVAASFYLNMGYFITLLIPTTPGGAGVMLPEISRFQSWLMENGIKTSTSQFTRLFINSFFMNSRTLSLGIGFLFAIDIVLVLIAFIGGLPLRTTLLVMGQSAIIILFYYLVWRTEPFTSAFEQNLDTVRTRLARDLPPWLISFLFLTGFFLVVLVFLTTIILMPGMTLNSFLTHSGITELAHRFSLVGILVVTQYFLIRYIHGITSRVMAERLYDHREQALQDLMAATRDEPLPAKSAALPGDAEERFEHTAALLESRIFTIKRNTLLGTFPVFVVDLDFSVLLDSTTRNVIRGYIRHR